ncbi:unnamed protein product [Notodromas monacha]|uniref:Mitochondrial ornithine transporter 1 n=1 Tax=Notodromas monacha TaxID=399045 RepID=A0A7R9GIH4_9CRUS|nr:unnamed protein product [Notodromas monacha]CAG0922458.1 unnamed protein product [Notodromas monacha]
MTTPSAEIVEEELRDKDAHGSVKDAAINFTAGSLGGIAGVYVGQPLDTVKVKMQAFPQLYTNMFKCLSDTYRKDGIWRGLYAGTIPAVVANVAENSVLFAGYGTMQSIAAQIVGVKSPKELPSLANACCGSAAAFFCALTLCPTELIKCKLQAMRETGAKRVCETTGQKVPWTPYALTAHVIRTEGFKGMFRGLGSTMIREMAGYFFFFGGYELTRELLTPPGKTKEEIGIGRTIVSGGIGGMTLWTVIFPFDVVKSRVQIQGSDAGVVTVIKEIYTKEGERHLFDSGLPIQSLPPDGVPRL